MDTDLSRRAFLSRTAMTAILVSSPAFADAFPRREGEQVLPFIDQPSQSPLFRRDLRVEQRAVDERQRPRQPAARVPLVAGVPAPTPPEDVERRPVGAGDEPVEIGRDQAGRDRLDHVAVEDLEVGEAAGFLGELLLGARDVFGEIGRQEGDGEEAEEMDRQVVGDAPGELLLRRHDR